MTKSRPQSSHLIGTAVILLAALVAVLPLLRHGPSCGHDFNFHVASWLDAANAWRHGILYPHWASSANFGAGEPRFLFYPPLTWMLGAALGLVMPWALVPAALTFLLLAGTGLATRALARQFLSEGAAMLAGSAALFSGYTLFTAYERTAYGELTGGFWIPLLLLFALRERIESHPGGSLWQRALDGSTAPLALVVAGCWLSNLPLGVMACYLLAAVAATAALQARCWAPIVRAALATVLGLGLTAIYLLPALAEQRWVDVRQATDLPGERIENSFLFARHADPAFADHDTVLLKVSYIAASMILVALAGLFIAWLRRKIKRELPIFGPIWLPLALIPLAVLFLQLPLSLPVWNLLPRLRFLQFPWRWLVVLEAPMAIFFAAALWPRRRWLRLAVVLLCAAFFVEAMSFVARDFYQACDESDSVAAMVSNDRGGLGFLGADEYAPPGADNGLLPSGLPAACLVADPAAKLGALPSDADPDQPIAVWNAAQNSCAATANWQLDLPEHKRLAAVLPHPGFLVLRLRSYPAWQLRLNGQLLIDLPQRDDGLIALPVAQGPAVVTADWRSTSDVLAGRWLSVFFALLLIGLFLLERRLKNSRRAHLS